jgi:hypothetical protein
MFPNFALKKEHGPNILKSFKVHHQNRLIMTDAVEKRNVFGWGWPNVRLLTTSRKNAYFSSENVLTRMTKASSIFVFVFVAIDFLIHKESKEYRNA